MYIFHVRTGRIYIAPCHKRFACHWCVQALVGGQPLLIVGLAEPIVIIYVFMQVHPAGKSL